MIREREAVSGLIDDNRKNMKTSVRSPGLSYDAHRWHILQFVYLAESFKL